VVKLLDIDSAGTTAANTTNNILADENTVGTNAYSNLFEMSGGGGTGTLYPRTIAQMMSYLAPRAGKPLDTASPKIGAIQSAYVNWDGYAPTSGRAPTISHPSVTIP
jgi:hypothetical protein